MIWLHTFCIISKIIKGRPVSKFYNGMGNLRYDQEKIYPNKESQCQILSLLGYSHFYKKSLNNSDPY